MNKTKKIAAIVLSLFILLNVAACAGETSTIGDDSDNGLSGYRKHESGLLFSNLVDENTQNLVRQALIDAGANSTKVADVFVWLNIFNGFVTSGSLLYSGFVQTDRNYVLYDTDVTWEENGTLYYDVNCHTVSFHLLRSLITVENPIIEEVVEDGFGVITPFRVHSNVEWTQDERNNFVSVFDLLFDFTASETETAEAIVAAWAERGISFTESKLSLVSVWSGSWVIHSAVLVEIDGGLLLFEKTNPLKPFQASIFNNTDEVRDYFIDQMHSAGLSDAMVTVMRNDVML